MWRIFAANALKDIGDGNAVEPLIICLTDLDPDVRIAAVGALGALGDHRAVKPLVAMFNDSDHSVHREAAKALHQLMRNINYD
jgi:HEAT repeat protein